ncbi:PilN domain-containing protein [Bacillus piscicola]|uniref:PilN domain-containing protein n=1 Tax=Bacillus piscicola TaxID=1632684 RepID=UPI001F09C9F1|nr:hypothetical protein [Bacillus piscicola]
MVTILIDVNLLPEKEKRDGTWLLTAVILVVLFALVFLLMGLLKTNIHNDIAALEEEQQEAVLTIEERTAAQSGFVTYQDTVKTLEQTINPVSAVLHNIEQALPENSVIATFDYTFPSTLRITARLEEVRQAAAMHDALIRNNVFTTVEMADLYYVDPLETSPETFHEEARLPRYEAVFDMNVKGDTLQKREEDPRER